MTTPATEKASPDRGTMIRVERDMLTALEKWVDALNTGNDGPPWTRAEVVRRVLGHALATRDPALLKPVKTKGD